MRNRQSMNIKELRNKQNFSQEGLAKVSGVGLRTIQRIENGEVIPQKQTLQKLAATLNVQVEDIKTNLDSNELGFLKRMTVLASVLFVQPLLSILVIVAIRGTNKSLSKTSKKYLTKLVLGQGAILLLLVATSMLVINSVEFSNNIGYLKASVTLFVVAFSMVGFLNYYLYEQLKKAASTKKP